MSGLYSPDTREWTKAGPTEVEPGPGERCDTCHRRVPKKRTSTAPETKRIVAVLPPDRAEALTTGLDNLQEFVRADGESYPRGTLLELLLVVGAHHREELKDHFATSPNQRRKPATHSERREP